MIFGIELYSFRFWVLVFCLVVGLFVFGRMLWLSRGPYKYSEYRQTRLDNMKEWLEDYNNGIYPVIGYSSADETWSYSDEGGYFC